MKHDLPKIRFSLLALIPCEERKNREFLILLFPQNNESNLYITYCTYIYRTHNTVRQ